MKELMTLKEVAGYLRLSEQTLYKMVQQGRIPALKAGALWRFRKSDVDAWMSNKAQGVSRRQRARPRRAARRA